MCLWSSHNLRYISYYIVILFTLACSFKNGCGLLLFSTCFLYRWGWGSRKVGTGITGKKFIDLKTENNKRQIHFRRLVLNFIIPPHPPFYENLSTYNSSYLVCRTIILLFFFTNIHPQRLFISSLFSFIIVSEVHWHGPKFVRPKTIRVQRQRVSTYCLSVHFSCRPATWKTWIWLKF